MREEIWWLINKTYPRVVQLSTYADSILQISYQKAHTTISEKWKIIAQLMSNRYTKQLPSLIPECSPLMPAFCPIWSCLPSNWWTCSVPSVFIWGVWLWPPDPNLQPSHSTSQQSLLLPRILVQFPVPTSEGPQLSVTPVLGDPTPSSGLFRHYMHMVCIKTHAHIKIKHIFKNFLKIYSRQEDAGGKEGSLG